MCRALQKIMEDSRSEGWHDGETAAMNLLCMGLPKDKITEAVNILPDVVEEWLK